MMSRQQLYVNTVVSMDGSTYRVLFIAPDEVALYDMSSSKSSIRFDLVSRATLMDQLNSGHAKIVNDPYEDLRFVVNSKHDAKMEESYELIKPIVSDPSILYSRVECNAAIKSIAGDDQVLQRKIYRLIARWFQRGQCKGALLPDYRSVGKGPRTLTKNLGRKGARQSPIMNDALRDLMAMIIKKYVLVVNHISLEKAYPELIKAYKDAYPDSQELPSFGQFRNFYYKVTTHKDRELKQFPEGLLNDKSHNEMSAVSAGANSIGAIYDLEAAVDNVCLISFGPHPISIGRPVIYLVTDRFSGRIVGFSVSLEEAKYSSAADAIYCAIAQKNKYFKESFGIDLPFEWDVSGLPKTICLNNVELDGVDIEEFQRKYSVAITNTLQQSTELNGSVESTLSLVQKELDSFFVKQSVTSNSSKKADRQDNIDNAFLTLQDYRAIVLYVIDIINHRVIRNTPATYPPALFSNPNTLWKWAVLSSSIELRSCENEESIHLSLLSKQIASISKKGINCSDIVYTCKEFEKNGLFDRDLMASETINPVIAIDNSNVSNAWIYPNPTKHPLKYYRCSLADESLFLSNTCMYEAQIFSKLRLASKRQTLSEQERLRRELRVRVKKMTECAIENLKQIDLSLQQSTSDTILSQRVKNEIE